MHGTGKNQAERQQQESRERIPLVGVALLLNGIAKKSSQNSSHNIGNSKLGISSGQKAPARVGDEQGKQWGEASRIKECSGRLSKDS